MFHSQIKVPRRIALSKLGAAAAGNFVMPSIGQTGAMTLRLGHVFPIDHPVSIGAVKAAAVAKERSGGRININIFPSAQLGGSRDLVQQAADGSLDFVIDGPGMYGNWHRPISVLEAPFVPKDIDQLVRMVEGQWSAGQFEQLAGKGLRKFSQPWYYGARHLTTRNREVHKLRDAAGLKIRVPENPVFLDMIRAIGATPTPMALPEVYLGLQTGVADGQENPLATIYAQKFHEVQGVLNLSAHIISVMLVMAASTTWSKFTVADRSALTEAFNEGGSLATSTMHRMEGGLVTTLRERGMKVVQTDRAEFQAAMAPVYQKNASIWGAGVVEQLRTL